MIYFISIIKPNPKNKNAERPSATAAFDYARHSLPTFLASQRCFFNIYLNICCSFRFHFSSVTFEWFKLDGCLCIHFFPPHLIQRMKSFHAPNIAPPHLPGNQQRKATECVKERDGMTKRQKSRRKRKTFVKKIWIWNENMLEWIETVTVWVAPTSLCTSEHRKNANPAAELSTPLPPVSRQAHNVANKTAHKKQYTIKSKSTEPAREARGARADAIAGFLEQELAAPPAARFGRWKWKANTIQLTSDERYC